MALYRFLFAPVLLAVAVVAGPRGAPERAPAGPRAEVVSEAAGVAPAPGVKPVPAIHVVPARAGRADPRRAAADR